MSEYGPEFDKFVARVRKELVPMIDGTHVFVAITPQNKDQVDVKFAVELGLAVMLNKPIVGVIRPGTEIPEKLRRVVDRFVELNLDDPEGGKRLAEAIKAFADEIAER